jgi:hypothetical protein
LDQAIRLLEGQRPEQNRIDDTENGGVRSDTHSQREYRHNGKARRLKQFAHAVT